MTLGTTYSPRVPAGGALSYKLWPVFTYSNGYWEVYRRFEGNLEVPMGILLIYLLNNYFIEVNDFKTNIVSLPLGLTNE